jgi:hypothetical protein
MADIVWYLFPYSGRANIKMDEGKMAQSDMEVRSINGESSPLSLGRNEDRHKEQYGGEQHNGRT